ncbi:serine hydrolase domain-containing protein [Rhodococcus sp. H29-C3]|uniref:serine hydrolase domain-containing protein n=1 Tax=Rhodococcus sp. H29-C3 TaxID=3046307 RepID=UPI0024B88838|nr:serine hydrolase domain-containing protein [Rhodococcus sp. H29-C3]MDJ0361902.1 serine hydrolase domain-containing protein [Rhodococcus sp. H29-C3]
MPPSMTRSPRRRHAAVAAMLTVITFTASCSSDTSPPTTDSAATASSATSTQSGDSALVPFDTTAMDAVVDETAQELREIGMVVLIETPDGKYTNSWGATELGGSETPTLDTSIRIGSNTKTWTGTAILQMVQEGKLSVDDPVSKYRPDVPNGENITIGQMLDMRSGLYNYTETVDLNQALDDNPARVWTPEELVALGLSNPAYFPPGEGWHYSNTNTVLLGLIAEKLDGKPIDQIFQDRFFSKLNMNGTSFPLSTDTAIPAPFARGYSYSGNIETLGEGKDSLSPERLAEIESGSVSPRDTTGDNPSWTWSAGQGISTVNDLATWVQAMVKGDLLDEKTQKLRMDSVASTDPESPKAANYGYGIAQMGPLFGHTGELPGYNSFMGYDPVNDVTMVIWGNLAPTAEGKAPAARLAEKLIGYVYATTGGNDNENTADDIGEVGETEGN